jgi:nicotinamidase-related amidase
MKKCIRNNFPDLISNIIKVITACRASNIPIIWVQGTYVVRSKDENEYIKNSLPFHMQTHVYDNYDNGNNGNNSLCCQVNTWRYDIIDDLIPYVDENDIFIHKEWYSAFNQTKLLEIINGMGIKELILGGVVTNRCIYSTIVHGQKLFLENDLDVSMMLLEECVAASPTKHSEYMEKIGNIPSVIISKIDFFIDTI